VLGARFPAGGLVTTDRRRTDRRAPPGKATAAVPADRRRDDRRKGDRRRAARAPLDLWVEEEKGEELYFRRTGNVSLGGIYFEQTIPHALGTKVKLRFSLPGSAEVIEALGEIVNTPQQKDGLGMGLRFVHLDAAAQQKLATFIDVHGQDE
jgi:uncharacterized protein (TIGR02266 family)